jgi:hypothetical protein
MIFVLLRFDLDVFRIIAKNGIFIFLILTLIEIAGQAYAWVNPGYKTLFIYPSKKYGWTYTPDIKFKYSEKHWYSREFSAVNQINSFGFRDLKRSFKKGKNTLRVALFGASIISGKESKFEDTIGQI